MIDTLFLILISALALGVSIMSALYSFHLQQAENKRSTREQLNGTVRELIKLNDEAATNWTVDPAKRDAAFHQHVSTITQTIASLSRQAIYLSNYLADYDPKLITDVEFITIAQGLVNAGDQLTADDYWQKGIKASPTEYYRIVNIRGYADFLFRQGKYAIGRSFYQQVLKIFDNDTDFHKYTNAYTYQMWMVSEAANNFREDAKVCYNRAKNLYESISQQYVKDDGIVRLENARKAFLSPGAPSTSGVA